MSAKRSSAKAAGPKAPRGVRTWIEIDRGAVRHNLDTFRRLVGRKVKLWAVVKSNAYGHGLFLFSKLLDRAGADGFCVDSVVEAQKLREEGTKKPILVLGPTLHDLFSAAARKKIAITVSTFEGLRALSTTKTCPEFHLKFDTGMHRQGFFPKDVSAILEFFGRHPKVAGRFTGIYTHFAAATEIGSAYTEHQFEVFTRIREAFAAAGYQKITVHAGATGGTLIDRRYHLDAVRVGKGLYGFFPAPALERSLPGVSLRPALSWRTYISELKRLPEGERVGYDLTEILTRPTTLAVIPVGYWHGLARALSGKGEVLVRGKRAKIVGRVSMDIAVVDVTGIPAKTGDVVTLIGRSGGAELSAWEVAERAGTIPYEFLTRLNPLIEKILCESPD